MIIDSNSREILLEFSREIFPRGLPSDTFGALSTVDKWCARAEQHEQDHAALVAYDSLHWNVDTKMYHPHGPSISWWSML